MRIKCQAKIKAYPPHTHALTHALTLTLAHREAGHVYNSFVYPLPLSLDVCRLISVCPSEQPAAHPHQGDPTPPQILYPSPVDPRFQLPLFCIHWGAHPRRPLCSMEALSLYLNVLPPTTWQQSLDPPAQAKNRKEL